MFIPQSINKVVTWQCLPPMKPPEVLICKPLIHEWNQGLHGIINRHRVTQYYFRTQKRIQAGTNHEATAAPEKLKEVKARTQLNVKAASTSKEYPARTQLDVKAASTSKECPARTTFDVKASSSHNYDEITRAKSVATVVPHLPKLANEPLALLYSLSTPGSLMAYQFDSDTERICIDTGASACLSTRRDNFISLRDLDNIKINGIASGLKVAGIGVLRWSIRDDNNTEIYLYIKDALYVPDAPMGLLCPQQIAQQTNLLGLQKNN